MKPLSTFLLGVATGAVLWRWAWRTVVRSQSDWGAYAISNWEPKPTDVDPRADFNDFSALALDELRRKKGRERPNGGGR